MKISFRDIYHTTDEIEGIMGLIGIDSLLKLSLDDYLAIQEQLVAEYLIRGESDEIKT